MASTLFSRAFLAASRRLITPSLLPETTLNLAAFLSKRSFYSQLGAPSTWARRAMASSGVGGKAGYSTSSVPTNEPVVSVDWLHSNLREPDLKVLDASWYMPEEKRNSIQEYQVAHVPGALFFDLDGISDRSTSLPHMLPSEEAFAAGCSALGIENKNGVVVYDAKGIYSAARVWWMFRAFGHNKVWVLDGGLPRWRASGYDVESSASGDAILKASAASEAIEKIYQGQTVSPVTFQTKFQQHLVWSLDQVKKNMEDQTHQHIDARSNSFILVVMAGIAIVLDLLKKSHNTHRIHSSSSLSPASVVASAAAVSAAASAPFASRFLFGSFEPRVAYCDAAAAAGIDDAYLAAIRKVSADALQLQPPTYIPSSKVYNIQPKPLFSAFEFRALAMTTVRSLLMFYLPLLEAKPASEDDDDDDFLNNAQEEQRRVDLIVPLKKSAKQIARETTVVTTRRVLERVAVSYVSQRMAWKLLKDVPQSTLRKAGRGWPTHVYIYKVSQTTLRGHFLGIAASWTVQVGIEIYRCVSRYVKPVEVEEEGEQVVISEQAKDLGNKVVGITVRCGASLVFAAIGAGICSCLIRPSMGQWIGCALGDVAGPMVVSICLQKTLQADN